MSYENLIEVSDCREIKDLVHNVVYKNVVVETGNEIDVPMFGILIPCKELDIWTLNAN